MKVVGFVKIFIFAFALVSRMSSLPLVDEQKISSDQVSKRNETRIHEQSERLGEI